MLLAIPDKEVLTKQYFTQIMGRFLNKSMASCKDIKLSKKHSQEMRSFCKVTEENKLGQDTAMIMGITVKYNCDKTVFSS